MLKCLETAVQPRGSHVPAPSCFSHMQSKDVFYLQNCCAASIRSQHKTVVIVSGTLCKPDKY